MSRKAATRALCLTERRDNHSAHWLRETRRYLASKPGRFELVFTPTHASGLNYVETLFSMLARSVPRRIRIDHGWIVAQGTAAALRQETGGRTLEDAFIALTGHSIREAAALPLDRMRVMRQVWRGRR